MAKFTQKAIEQTFLSILDEKSLDKITVKDIIERAGINRNTFYYYYADIFALIDSIFEEEMEEVLADEDPDRSFYDEYIRAASILLDHRNAVFHIYHSRSREILYRYMQKVTGAFVERFVIRAAEPYGLSEDGIRFITYFYTSATIGNTMHWIQYGMPALREELLRLISTSFEATVDDMIRNYMENCEKN